MWSRRARAAWTPSWHVTARWPMCRWAAWRGRLVRSCGWTAWASRHHWGAAATVSPSSVVTGWHARLGVRQRSGERPLAMGSGPHDAHPTHGDPGRDVVQVWTPDSRRVIFSSERAGGRNLFWQAADGTGAAERLLESPDTQYPMAVSPDGRQLIFSDETPRNGHRPDGDGTRRRRRVTPLLRSRFTERNGIISPDGRWLAYEADDSGRFEIYVRPYPDVNGGLSVVPPNGGTKPIWTRSGQELIYVSRRVRSCAWEWDAVHRGRPRSRQWW